MLAGNTRLAVNAGSGTNGTDCLLVSVACSWISYCFTKSEQLSTKLGNTYPTITEDDMIGLLETAITDPEKAMNQMYNIVNHKTTSNIKLPVASAMGLD